MPVLRSVGSEVKRMLSGFEPQEDTRVGQRYDYPSAIEYRLDTPGAETTLYRAVTINISSSGFGAYMFDHQMIGQRIFITSPLPGEKSTAVVRWIKKENDGIFMAGFKFNGSHQT